MANTLKSHYNTLILREIQQKEACLSFYQRHLEGKNTIEKGSQL